MLAGSASIVATMPQSSSAGEGRSRAEGDRLSLWGSETGLPLICCPDCKNARVIEMRSKKENENFGRVFFKCERNFTGMHRSCGYYKWQKKYLEDLVDNNIIVMHVEDLKDDVGVVNLRMNASGIMRSNAIEAKMNNLFRVVQLLFVIFVAVVVIIFVEVMC